MKKKKLQKGLSTLALTENNFLLGTEDDLQRDPSEGFPPCVLQFYHFKLY